MNFRKSYVALVFSLSVLTCGATTLDEYKALRTKNPTGLASYLAAEVDGFYWAYEAAKNSNAKATDHSFCLPKGLQLNGQQIMSMLDRRIEEDSKNPVLKMITELVPMELTLLNLLQDKFPCTNN